jgi:hypothetical protein
MNDPWQLFGLDANRCTVPELKKAYARLLRENRPDEDPAGFQAVHQAYQRALKLLSLRGPVPPDQPLETTAVEGLQTGVQAPTSNCPLFEEWEESEEEAWDDEAEADPNPDLADNPLPPPEKVPVSASPTGPFACAKELADLELLLGSRRRGAHFFQNRLKVIRACVEVSQAMTAAGIRAEKRSSMWANVLGDDASRLTQRLRIPVLMELFQLDQLGFCQRVTRQWLVKGNRQRLGAFARALTEVKTAMISNQSSAFLMELALEIALDDPATAERLASTAYRYYGHKKDNREISKVDLQIWLGKQLLRLPKDLRKIWTTLLGHDKPKVNEKAHQVFRTLYATVEAAPNNWVAWSIIHSRLSAELQGFLDRCLMGKASGIAASKLHVKEQLLLGVQSFYYALDILVKVIFIPFVIGVVVLNLYRLATN